MDIAFNLGDGIQNLSHTMPEGCSNGAMSESSGEVSSISSLSSECNSCTMPDQTFGASELSFQSKYSPNKMAASNSLDSEVFLQSTVVKLNDLLIRTKVIQQLGSTVLYCVWVRHHR